jgi:hypothetical protein
MLKIETPIDYTVAFTLRDEPVAESQRSSSSMLGSVNGRQL